MDTNLLTNNVLSALQALENDLNGYEELTSRLLLAAEGTVFPLDLLAISALNRMINLTSGFDRMIRERNFICAGAILRLQLDTSLRFFAAWQVQNPHSFAASVVLDGTPVSKIKDRDGKHLSDRHLVNQLSKDFPWIETVYNRTCDYVHLSKTHFLFAVSANPSDQDRAVDIRIGRGDPLHMPESIYLEAIDAFRNAASILDHYLNGWIETKNRTHVTKSSAFDKPQT
ncbi:MAG TPA: hypothetical protein VG711_13115 [Phycisphaerales bacterium]|nr:hypothetical protein [Phycisphaerales bacterium]